MDTKTVNIFAVIIFAFIFNIKSYAQVLSVSDQWLNHYEKGYNLFTNNEFAEAIPHFLKASKLTKDINFNDNIDYQYYPVYNHDYLATAYYRTNNFEDAATNYKKALEHFSGIKNPDEVYGKRLLNDLIFSYQKYNPEKAITFTNLTLKSIELDKGKVSIDYAEFLFTLYQLNSFNGNNDALLQNLEDAYKIHDELNSTDHAHFSVIVFNLAYTYFFKEDYANALVYFEKTDTLLDTYKTQKNINIGKLTYDYAVCLFKLNAFKKAEKKYKFLNENSWLLSPENAEYYLYSSNDLGLCLYYQDKIDEAKQTYYDSLDHLKKVLDTSDPLLALQKTNLTKILIYTEEYKEAMSLSEDVQKTMKFAGYTESQAYINSINNLGLLYMYNSEFTKAQTFLNESLKITENNFDADALNIANIKNNLAYVYQKLGKYPEAKKLHQDVLKTKTDLVSNFSPEYAKALINYGTFLFTTGEYLNAENYFKKGEAIFNKINDNTSIKYAGLKLNLAELYSTTSQLKKSINNYEKAIGIYKNKGLVTSENLAQALNGKANCLLRLGDKPEAIKLSKQAFEIITENFGKETLQYGDALFNHGKLFYLNGNYGKSNSYFNQAFEIFKKHLDFGTPRFIELANYYIEDLVANNDYDTALSLIEEIEKNIIKTYGFESFNYAKILNQKAHIASLSKNYEYANQLYQSVSAVYKKTIDTSSNAYSQMRFNYAVLLDKSNLKNEALQQYKSYYQGIQNQLKDVFTYRSESDKKKFLNQLKLQNDWLNGSVFKNTNGYEGLVSVGLNNQLMLKSLLLNTSKEVIKNLSKSNDASVNKKVDDYSSIKFQLSDYKVLKDKQRTLDLKTKLNRLETELVKLHDSKFKKTSDSNFNRDWTKIKAKLKANEIAIEFVEFEIREENYITKNKKYGAYLITSTSQSPKAINLFMADDLKIALKNKNPNTLYQTRGSKAKNTTNTKGLYELIWLPLEGYLDGMETIYFSPTGLLNQIPFAALDTKDKPILASQYNLVQLSSTYVLAESRMPPKTDNTLFIGGINYDSSIAILNKESEQTISELSVLKSVSGTRSLGSKWNYLPGTLKEVNAIETLFSKTNKVYNTLLADKATETHFKNMSGKSPNVIHIATHGFFFENPKQAETKTLNIEETNVYKSSEDPLLRSGLILSGANRAWQNGDNPNSEDDGILTALEISNLDLSNTDMVVLSACETGLGDIEGSEGVYGLQRAFKMAGVDLIIMSLWEVPDTETSEFMTIFYTNWLNGQEIRIAFRNTQLTMAKKHKDNPEKWAAFVLFE